MLPNKADLLAFWEAVQEWWHGPTKPELVIAQPRTTPYRSQFIIQDAAWFSIDQVADRALISKCTHGAERHGEAPTAHMRWPRYKGPSDIEYRDIIEGMPPMHRLNGFHSAVGAAVLHQSRHRFKTKEDTCH